MKYFKFTLHELCVFLLVAGAFIIRILLASQTWPLPNSDEGTIGIMAMHILHGARPVFFYGQFYMGALDAYIAATFFAVFGVSVFTLRLGIILLFVFFLVSLYLLARSLYNKHLALFTVLLFAMGSNAVLSRQLSVIGGYPETIFLGTFLFLLAFWLARSTQNMARQERLWRLLGYSSWGFAVGLGIWSDLLILPFIACSGFVLLLFCWRELLKGAVIPLILCVVLGALPFIAYNIYAAPGQDSWSVLLSQQTQTRVSSTINPIVETVDLSIPMITGNPFCHTSDLPQLDLLGFQQSNPPNTQCKMLGAGWGISYLLLFVTSMVLTILALKKALISFNAKEWSQEQRRSIIRYTVQLLVLLSGALTIVLYVRSHSPYDGAAILSRYMIGLWVCAPAVLWPLWLGARKVQKALSGLTKMRARALMYACQLVLVVIAGIFVYGIGQTLSEIPQAQAAEQQEQRLISTLQQKGIRHVYGDYWLCNRIAFQSQERIVCGVLDEGLHPRFNRYKLYYTAVSGDAKTSYVVPRDNQAYITAIEKKLRQENTRYQRFTLDDYVIYQVL